MDPVARQFLPPKLIEIAQVIGLDAALKLSAAWPGIRLTVPKDIRADHPIALHLGIEAAGKLASIYGGDTLVPPMCTRYHRERLNERILQALETRSAADVAREYGIHQFSIYRLKSKADRQRQGTLL